MEKVGNQRGSDSETSNGTEKVLVWLGHTRKHTMRGQSRN